MKYLLLILILIVSPARLYADIIHHQGWEDGFGSVLQKGTHHCDGCTHALTTGTSYTTESDSETVTPYEGDYLMRALVRSGDPAVLGHPARAQLYTDPDDSINSVGHRVDRWYGFVVYFPSDDETIDYETSTGVFDFHGVGEYAGAPPMNFIVRGGPGDTWVTGYQMRLQVYDVGDDCGNTDEMAVIDITDKMDQWIEVVLKVNFDDRDPDVNGVGTLALWVDGVVELAEQDFQICHPHYANDDFYLKIGANVSSTPDYPLENFYDAFRIGDEDSSYSEVAPSEQTEATEYTLTVSKNGTGTGTITDGAEGAIDCGSTCTDDYVEDTEVTLSHNADAGSDFISWSGDCSGSGACVVTMSAAKSVTATFNLESDAEEIVIGGATFSGVTFN